MSIEEQGYWTKAEYDAAPEMAGRLHDRILDLQGQLEAIEADLDEFGVERRLGGMALNVVERVSLLTRGTYGDD